MAKSLRLADLGINIAALVAKQSTFDAFKKQLMLALQEIMQVGLGAIKRAAPVNFGLLRGSIAGRIRFQQPFVIVEFFSPTKYARFMEEGFSMGGKMPPEAPILQWVKRKKLKPRGRWAKKAGRNPQAQAKRVAYAIRKVLARRGGPKDGPYKYFDAGIKVAQANSLRILQRRLTIFAKALD